MDHPSPDLVKGIKNSIELIYMLKMVENNIVSISTGETVC